MTIDRPLSDRPEDGSESVSKVPPQSWITTIARLRGLCGLWLIAILALAFLPYPMRAQPPKAQIARRVALDSFDTPDAEAGPGESLGDEEVPPPSTGEKAKRSANLLVLKNGRLVEGQISQSAGGYVVDRPNGSLLVPFDRVSFEAEDRTDAYHKVRSKMPAKAASSNIALARWCLSYDMFSEAEAELREALKLEPNREEARSMLAKLEELRNPESLLNRETPRTEPKTDDGFDVPNAESLGGFSRDTAQEFVTRIQPMLTNRCGNASCHGGREPSNGFPLVLVKNGRSNRASAERNLSTVLHQIDLESPDRSPLITIAQGNHGGVKALFHGPKATEHLESLRVWVRKAAREERARLGDTAARPAIVTAATTTLSNGRPSAAEHEPPVVSPAPEGEFSPPIIPAGAQVPADGPRRPRPGEAAHPLMRAANPGKRPAADIVKKTLKEQQPDPFDPDEFNRSAPKK